MTQTQRTLDQIYGDDLDDNTTGDTTNQNVRNAVETLRECRGELSLSASASTTIVTQSVYVKLAGTTILSSDPDPYNVSMPADNRLKYDGAAPCYGSIRAYASLDLDSGVNQYMSMAIYKNGVLIPRTESPKKLYGTSDINRITTECLTRLVNGDYLEVWIANLSSTANVTAIKLQMILETKAIEQ